jgi:hypothetical protein
MMFLKIQLLPVLKEKSCDIILAFFQGKCIIDIVIKHLLSKDYPMLMGIRLQAHPSKQQKLILSRWMGCARFVWNAKCEEENYLRCFARKYLVV